ncbi:DUF4269 domain-containing protein [Paenibacillus lautus]|uniref:DUF4269 domain-containing protein n=1 Tax=Paenibacillus lautus TaxID=1401 RepID=UPI001C0F7059|nr:DUF4269 domain-containing protein [Paenibacillus lautus]MBU5346738.1 DUF4269 domain-containing protein [Paenibacillus lautus]
MQENMDFLNLEYLRLGSDKQKKAALVIDELRLWDHLKPYNPILVGTIPIGIDIESSDLDIICEVTDFACFERVLKTRYSEDVTNFTFSTRTVNNVDRTVARFRYTGWEFEIFAQPLPSTKQNGYRHMIVEYKLLKRLGEAARLRIIELKRSGYKTEPAFAKLLHIAGDPYEELLKMYHWPEDRLDAYIKSYMDKENGYE